MEQIFDAQKHWENIYGSREANEVSWFTPHLEKSLGIIARLNLPKDSQIIDIGGGASTLPDDLRRQGFKNITVLDISAKALETSKARMGKEAESVHWIKASIAQPLKELNRYDLWHDRAVFHFLRTSDERKNYAANLKAALKPGGHAVLATFGPNGPLKCSGLEIVRYSAESLQNELGKSFKLKEHFLEIHKTPFDTTQEFLYCIFEAPQS